MALLTSSKKADIVIVGFLGNSVNKDQAYNYGY